MTTHLHFDLVGGIAGDMAVAALVDAGAPFDALVAALRDSGLPFAGARLVHEWRGGMAGARFVVEPERDPPHRTWAEIERHLGAARLPDRARSRALAIFGGLARAEARVHGCDVGEVHFHEVGALDAIVDVVAAALATDLLDAASFSCGPVPVGRGTVTGGHGVLPLPAPAAGVLLEGFELRPIDAEVETVTPTGAAILAALVDPPGRAAPPTRLLRSGFGLGTVELPDRANVLRVLVGEPVAGGPRGRPSGADAVVIEAAIDDMDPRLYGSLAADLFAAGALDVTLAPLQMKKQRPGTLLSVLCRPELEGVLSGMVLRQTTTLGVRSHDVRRTELDRRMETLETRFGRVPVKLAFLGGECVNASPEYDACERLARAAGAPLKDVLAAAAAAATERWLGGAARARDSRP